MSSETTGVFLNVTQLAHEFGANRETISRKLKAAEVPSRPCPVDGRISLFRLRDAVKAIFTTDETGQKDPNLMEPHQRASHYKAEEAKQRLAIQAKELIPAAEVEAEMAAAFKLVAQTLETIPDLLERDAGLNPSQIEIVEKHLDKLRVGMADRLAEGTPVTPAAIEDVIRKMAAERPMELLALMKGSEADPFS